MSAIKNLTSLLFLLLLLECNGSTKTIVESQSSFTSKSENDIQTLLSKFKEISTDTIKVISSLDFDKDNYSFKGALLDSSAVSLLPSEFTQTYQSDKNFYACFKFPIDNTHTGLIIRTPSMYTPTSLKLFVLDTSKSKIINTYIELAETVIQLVEYWDKRTFIIKDKNSHTTFLMWEHQNEDTTEIAYTIRFKNEKFDTVSVVKR